MPKMLNTQQYVAMRKEAFKNDGIVPTASNATDLMVWDTTRYDDWTKILMDETARSYDAQVRFSGGNLKTRFHFPQATTVKRLSSMVTCSMTV